MRRSRFKKSVRKKALYLAFTVSVFVAYSVHSGGVLKGFIEPGLNMLLPDNFKVAIRKDQDRIVINTGLRHVDFKGIDIVGEAISTVEPKFNVTKFDISFKNLIINYTPLFKDIEIQGEYIRKTNLISISSISVVDKYKKIIGGHGKIDFSNGRYVDLYFIIKDLMLEEFILTKYNEEIATGIMNGELRIKGPLERVKTNAHFDVQNGKIQNLEFQSLIAALKGEGHIINMEDGRIIKEGGNLIMSGEIDFSLFPDSKAFDNLKIETDQRVAVWSGWEISKRFESGKIKAQKKLAKDIAFSFETYVNKDFLKADQTDRKNEIGVEYKLDKNESLKMRLKDKESFLGLEHKVKF